MSLEPAINWEEGVNYFQSETFFREELDRYDGQRFNSELENLFQAMVNRDKEKIYLYASTLKGSMYLISAEKAGHLADKMIPHIWEDNEKLLVESYIEFLQEAKNVELNLAKIRNRNPDAVKFDVYQKEVKRLLLHPYDSPMKNSRLITLEDIPGQKSQNMCQGCEMKCNIF